MRPCIFEFDSRDGRNEVNAIRPRSQLHDLVRFAEISRAISRPPKPKAGSAARAPVRTRGGRQRLKRGQKIATCSRRSISFAPAKGWPPVATALGNAKRDLELGLFPASLPIPELSSVSLRLRPLASTWNLDAATRPRTDHTCHHTGPQSTGRTGPNLHHLDRPPHHLD